MSFPTSFYKYIIFSSAKRFREEKNCVIGSEQWRITVETASAYINLTDEILEIFSNDSEELLNIASIRQKMEETIDEHQVKLIMDVLVENEIIQPIEKEENLYYRLKKPLINPSWQDKIACPLVILIDYILMKK